ncbi:MAG: hypothetical protein WCG42_09170, partial [Parachlamydiaceae bacterium]
MRLRSHFILFLLSYLLLVQAFLQGTTFTVSSTSDNGTSGTLRFALLNAANGDTINFTATGTIVIGSSTTYPTALPYLTGVTINGTNNIISGTSTYPIFFAYSGSSTINN